MLICSCTVEIKTYYMVVRHMPQEKTVINQICKKVRCQPFLWQFLQVYKSKKNKKEKEKQKKKKKKIEETQQVSFESSQNLSV